MKSKSLEILFVAFVFAFKMMVKAIGYYIHKIMYKFS